MAAKSIIINADDLGMNNAVTAGIFDAWAAGAIGDISAFANTKDLPALIERATDEAMPMGVHLNLVHGHPLCPVEEVPGLVGADGSFLAPDTLPSPLPVEQVEREWRAQVAAFLDLGFWPSHLDGHYHHHLLPEVMPLTIALALEFGLPVRASTLEERDILRAAGVTVPDCFCISFWNEGASVATLMRAVEECPGGVLEIMTHPGRADGTPAMVRRAQELAVLTSREWRVFLSKKRVPIIGFSEIGCGKNDGD